MGSSLIAVLIQFIFTCAAGWLLWTAWRRLAAINARAGTLLGAGLAIRALTAQAMFWISYLHLPIARSLQDGDGFWTLAVDGRVYFGNANDLLAHGWTAVALVDKTLPSPAFLQVLAVFQFLFGGAASVGALLNLFAYLGGCAAILCLGRAADGHLSAPVLIALAAVSFGPALIIWSVQPLKDPFFIFAVAAFVVACTLWQEAWRGRVSTSRFVIPLLLMLIVMYTVVGIRWYFGLLLWIASLPFFAAAAWRSNRRVAAAVTNAIVFLALSQVIIFAGGPYIKGRLTFPFGSGERNGKSSLSAAVVRSRQNFDESRGNTLIASGEALQRVDEPHVVSADESGAPVHIADRRLSGNAASKRILPTQPASHAIRPVDLNAAPPSDFPLPMSSGVQPPKSAAVRAANQAIQKSVAAKEPTTHPEPARETTHTDQRKVVAPAAPPTSAAAAKSTVQSGATPSYAPTKSVRTATKQVHQLPPAPVQKTTEKPLDRQRPIVAAEPAAIKTAVSTHQADILPQSTVTRVTAGLTAIVLPHFVGEWLGLIHIGGGRGLWAIVETDTLVFDCLLIVALYYVFRTLAQGAWRNPSFWLVVITTAGITVLLAYTISNFGTLFRHRAMIFIGLCLMLVVSRGTPRDPIQEDVSSGT